MLEYFSQLPDFVIYTGVVLIVVILDLLIQIPIKFHPITLFKVFASRLTAKVLPDLNRPKNQQVIAGSLTVLTITLPWVLMIAIFVNLTEYPLFFEGFILWICLGIKPCYLDIHKAEVALKKQQKILARDRIDDWLLRKTSNLTEVGIAKAACEALLIRNCYYYQTMIISFMLLGPYFTLALRLLLELTQVANQKLVRYQYFSTIPNKVLSIILWLPSKLTAFTYMNHLCIKQTIRNYRQSSNWPYTNSKLLLASAAANLTTRLGGPVFYQEQKIQRSHINQDASQPDHHKIKSCRYLIIAANLLLILGLVFISVLIKHLS